MSSRIQPLIPLLSFVAPGGRFGAGRSHRRWVRAATGPDRRHQLGGNRPSFRFHRAQSVLQNHRWRQSRPDDRGHTSGPRSIGRRGHHRGDRTDSGRYHTGGGRRSDRTRARLLRRAAAADRGLLCLPRLSTFSVEPASGLHSGRGPGRGEPRGHRTRLHRQRRRQDAHHPARGFPAKWSICS